MLLSIRSFRDFPEHTRLRICLGKRLLIRPSSHPVKAWVPFAAYPGPLGACEPFGAACCSPSTNVILPRTLRKASLASYREELVRTFSEGAGEPMRTAILVLALLFSDVHCAYHPMAMCHGTGEVKLIGGHNYEKYSCSCGDDVWVPAS